MIKKISVRKLVEFILRRGSIESGQPATLERAREGSRLHRLIQKQGGKDYKSEVFLSLTKSLGDIRLTVEGRADGIIQNENGVTLDEIKSTSASLELIDESSSTLHWAQAKCYGHMYCQSTGLSAVTLRLSYIETGSEKIKHLYRNTTAQELDCFFTDIIAKYRIWLEFERDWITLRDSSISSLTFPFEQYRDGQRRMAAGIYRTISAGSKLYISAPTGIGKTISALFPAVKSIGSGLCEKIFYLTAKTITRKAAQDAVSKMQGLSAKSISLTAKEKMCINDKCTCSPSGCPYADGHYDRINDAVFAQLISGDTFTRENIQSHAAEHKVCPYELSLELSYWCDIIICDYNYAFDPHVYLRRFFSDSEAPYVFLVDEAHNLLHRAREMFSASISKSSFLNCKKYVPRQYRRLRRIMNSINRLFLDFRKENPDNTFVASNEPHKELIQELEHFSFEFSKLLSDGHSAFGSELNPELLQLYFDVLAYLNIYELYDENYRTIMDLAAPRDAVSKLFCINPAKNLSDSMKRCTASILFSATLTPIDFYASLLGADENSRVLTLPSPFKQENLCLLIAEHISTRYSNRHESLEPICDMIFTAAMAKPGNYIVYFPSYRYLNDVYSLFTSMHPGIDTVLQSPGLKEHQRENFLSQFENSGNTLIGFCVLGGIFSEGIDLAGDRLLGSIIIGVGLPQVNCELDLIKSSFAADGLDGFSYAYSYPGMNKVLQAAGRVIRSPKDKGLVLLIDDRFTWDFYKRLFPDHWSHWKSVNDTASLNLSLADFFSPFTSD